MIDTSMLTDPDMVGSSEYLAAYELIENAEDLPHAIAILDELEGHAKNIRSTLSPDKASTKEEPLLEFARRTLAIMESHEEWDSDTMDEINSAALDLNLAGADDNGLFKALI